jgi:hypothetical protein
MSPTQSEYVRDWHGRSRTAGDASATFGRENPPRLRRADVQGAILAVLRLAAGSSSDDALNRPGESGDSSS